MNWAVVYTHPKQEDRVFVNLHRQGFRAWVPKRWTTRKRRGRFFDVEEVLFPNYVFVHLLPDQLWSPVNSTFGARYLLSDGKRPRFLPAGFVEAMQQEFSGDCSQRAGRSSFRVDEPVRVIRGPFAGFFSRVTQLLPHDRVRLLFDLMGQDVSVVIPEAFVVRNTG